MMAHDAPITAINHPAAVSFGMSFVRKHMMKPRNKAPKVQTTWPLKKPLRNCFIINFVFTYIYTTST